MGWNRVVDLLFLPVRLGLAFGLAFLSYSMPWLAAGILGVLFVLGLAGMCVFLWIRWQVRSRARMACHECGYKVLRAAKICPQCHTPTLLTSVRELEEGSQALALHAAWEILQSDDARDLSDQHWAHALEVAFEFRVWWNGRTIRQVFFPRLCST